MRVVAVAASAVLLLVVVVDSKRTVSESQPVRPARLAKQHRSVDNSYHTLTVSLPPVSLSLEAAFSRGTMSASRRTAVTPHAFCASTRVFVVLSRHSVSCKKIGG